MTNQGNHMITRCSWDTSFDSKQLAGEFQMQISHWSKYHMLREINTVFDSICPKGHTLKIQKLELDLGVIAYDDFMSQLPILLKEQLRLQLQDMIMYPKSGNKPIEIISEDASQLQVVKYFLMQGVLPWNYHTTHGSVQQMATSLLSVSRLDFIEMIQAIGVKKNVRKRIAWQFKEQTIKKIITGLEPNNHKKIIDFSDEFIKIQEKETIVQTSTNDLKKNLWFWILNYLFTDRGTIFNSIAFIRSTIQQMAQHFNVTYETLFELIEEAITKTREYTSVNKGFIAILEILAKELRTTTYASVVTEKQKENLWTTLAHYLVTPSARSTSSQKQEFNELVLNLSKENSSRFQKICVDAHQKISDWTSVLNDLIPAAIEVLFTSIAPQKSKQLIQQIMFLTQLGIVQKFNIAKKRLYEIGMDFILNKNTIKKTNKSFLLYSIEKLTHTKKEAKKVLLEKLLQTEIPQACKNVAHISIQKELQQMYFSEIQHSKNIATKELSLIIEQHEQAMLHDTFDDKHVELLEKTILKWLHIAPIKTWNFIIAYPNKSYISVRIPKLITSREALSFIEKTSPKHAEVLKKLQQTITKLLSDDSKNSTTYAIVKNEIVVLGLQLLIQDQKLSVSQFILQIITLLKRELTLENLETCIQKIIQHPNIKTIGISSQEYATIQQQTAIVMQRSVLEEIQELIANNSKAQEPVAAMLQTLVHTKQTTTSEFQKTASKVIQYLLSNGIELQKEVYAIFTKKITALYSGISTTKLQKILSDSFWQTIVAYTTHKGNKRAFITAFEKAIAYEFPMISEDYKTQKTTVSKKHKEYISQQYELTYQQLFEAITQLIKQRTHTVIIENNSYEFAALIVLGLETAPEKVIDIIQENITTEQHVEQLRKAISFEQFMVLISKSVSDTQQEIIVNMQALFYIVKKMGTAQVVNTIRSIFWNKLIVILRLKTNLKEELKTLTRQTFEKIATIKDVNSVAIVQELQRNNFELPTLLKEIFIAEYAVFELVPEKAIRRTISVDLEVCIAKEKLEALCTELILHGNIPFWFQHKQKYQVNALIHEILVSKPLAILQTLRTQKLSKVQLIRLANTIDFSTLITVLKKLYPHAELTAVEKLYHSILYVTMRGISTKHLQEILALKVFKAWSFANWTILESTQIWNEFIWEVCTKKGVNKKHFTAAFQEIKTLLPTVLQITFNSLIPVKKQVKIYTEQQKEIQKIKEYPMENKSPEMLKHGVPVPNAGLVMLNSYFKILFDRLGIIENNAFKTPDDQLNAVHYLQYIVTGLTTTEESLLVLNKVLCGISPNTPVKESLDITDANKELIDGLIKAAIGYWSAIGDSTINGFRGNWLVREGMLREEEERWELTVEKRAYDILLNQSPFSFSIIKLPWMSKPLHVNWAY